MTSDKDSRVNRRLSNFVSKVESLGPSEWGVLEAAGARLFAKDPAGFLDRSTYIGRAISGLTGVGELLTVPAAAALQVGGWAVGNLADGIRIVFDRPRPAPLARSVADALGREAAKRGGQERAGFMEATERLSQRAVDALGSADSARPADPVFYLLLGAALAIHGEDRMSAEQAARLYAPVEPVIPWESLDEQAPPAGLLREEGSGARDW
jgi:hypothetical protein